MLFQLRYNVPDGPTLYHEFDAAEPADTAALEALGVANLPIARALVSQVDISKVVDRQDLQAAVASELVKDAAIDESKDKAAAEAKILALAASYSIDLKALN